jgi:hypothetical protein
MVGDMGPQFGTLFYPRLYSKIWPMLSIFDSDKQKIAVRN